MGPVRQTNLDRIAIVNDPSANDNAHDPGFPNEPHAFATLDHRLKKSFLECVDLDARTAKSPNLDDSVLSNLETRASRQAEQIDPARGDVLTEVAGQHIEPSGVDFVQKLGVN